MTIIRRPILNGYFDEDKPYAGRIESVSLCQIKSSFYAGSRDAVRFQIQVKDENEQLVTLFFSPTYSWSASSKFYKTLINLEALPKPGEDFNLDSLVGLNVLVRIKLNEKDEMIYSNVVELLKNHEAAAQLNLDEPSERKIVKKKAASIAPNFFDDEDE